MAFTLLGIVAAGIAMLMLVLQRPAREFLVLLIVSSVLGAAEAISLPALGGASLVLPFIVLPFFAARLVLTDERMRTIALSGVIENRWLVCYALLGVLGALILPRLFQGVIEIIPMRPVGFPISLAPSPQNITQAVYLVFAAAAAICAYVAARASNSDRVLVTGMKWAALAYLATALVDVVTYYAGIDGVLNWARTANYAVLDQSEMGIRRISGSFTEPSAFASFGMPLLCFFAARWLYGANPRASAWMAIALALALLMSTAATAYGCLFVVTLLLLVGPLVLPGVRGGRLRKTLAVLGFLILLGALGFIVSLFIPGPMNTALALLERMTIGKASSPSAIERATWAQQGYDAFVATWGLGAGPGSFRSSGLIPAVLGSLGVAGLLVLLLHTGRIARAALRAPHAGPIAIGALGALAGPVLSGATPDPGLLFALLSGFCIGRASVRNTQHAYPGPQPAFVIQNGAGAYFPALREGRR